MANNNAAEDPRPNPPTIADGGGFNPGGFLRDTKAELDKVVWPSRQQLISESAAVLLMVSLSATLIYLVNQLFSWASSKVFG